MELHQYILAEQSTCVIKDEEAILVLTKEKKGVWLKLLKNKVKWKWRIIECCKDIHCASVQIFQTVFLSTESSSVF